MKFKMRVLYLSKVGNAEQMALAISKRAVTTCDKMPPAYPCVGEKLLFIGIEESGSKAGENAVNFCNDLTTDRTKNVAFYATSSSDKYSGIEQLRGIVESKGIKVHENIFKCKVGSGLFRQGKVKDADLAAVSDWAQKIIDSLG